MPVYINPVEILSEVSSFDIQSMNSILTEDAIREFVHECDSIPTIYNDIHYVEEVIPVFNIPKTLGCTAVVEIENVLKYMDSNGIEDITEAISDIARYYDVNPTQFGVLIESDEDLEDTIEDMKTSAKVDKKKVGIIKKATNSIKDLKEKGIKVFKRPSKKKKEED